MFVPHRSGRPGLSRARARTSPRGRPRSGARRGRRRSARGGPGRRRPGGRRRRRRPRRGRRGWPAGAGRRGSRRPGPTGRTARSSPSIGSVITRAPLATASKSRLETNPSARMSSWWSLRTTPAERYAAASSSLGIARPRTTSSGTRPDQRSPYTASGRPAASASRTTGRSWRRELPTKSTACPVAGPPASGWKRAGSVACSSGSIGSAQSRARRSAQRRAGREHPVVAAHLLRGDLLGVRDHPQQRDLLGAGVVADQPAQHQDDVVVAAGGAVPLRPPVDHHLLAVLAQRRGQ